MSFFRFFALLATVSMLSALTGCGREYSAGDMMAKAVQLINSKSNPEEAAEYAMKAAALEPENPQARIIAAIACEQDGRYEDAVREARQAVILAPDSFAAQYTLGRLYASSRSSSYDALVALGKALKLRPDDRNTLVLLTNVTMYLSPEKAYEYLAKLGRNSEIRNSRAYQNQLGICRYRRKQFEQAGQAFIQAYRHDRSQGQASLATYNLAYFFDHCKKNGSMALTLYRSYLNQTPDGRSSGTARKLAAARIRALQR